MKMGKSKWIHDPSRRNIHCQNNLRFDAIIHFRKIRKSLKNKIEELENNSKTNIYKDINGIKNGY